jgi:hypothetical protein
LIIGTIHLVIGSQEALPRLLFDGQIKAGGAR